MNRRIDDDLICVCCGREIPSGHQYCIICGMETPKKQRQIDRIRNMSVEELAEFMCETNENCETFCALTKNGKCNSFAGGKQTCIMGIKQWLETEVGE